MADTSAAMENLFKAIDIIAQERFSSLGYDKTIKATIVDDSNADHGEYIVSDGASEFKAYAADVKYEKNMTVYVIIPEGDYTNQKLIVGKYSNNGDSYYNYVNPSEDFLDATHNIIKNISAGSLKANDSQVPYVKIWSCDGLDYKGYSRLALKGNFRTWLSSLDVISGTYGLVLYVVSKEVSYNGNAFERTYKYDLMSSDMYGDPFNFETYYLQEKVFDISELSDIVSIELLLVQNSDFVNSNGEFVAPYGLLDTANYPDNIFVEMPYISLGYDLNEVTKDEVRLYTLDSDTYDASYDEAKRAKTIELRWIHLNEDGTASVIDLPEEIPNNAIIHWYKNILDRSITDKLAGPMWVELPELKNCFSYSFVPDILVGTEKFKVIIEFPSREHMAALATMSEKIEIPQEIPKIYQKPDENGIMATTDKEIIELAKKSYYNNKLLSFQEYKQVINEFNSSYAVDHNGENYQNYDNAILALDEISQLQSQVQIYKSEVLTFVNESYDPVSAAIDLISSLEILPDVAGYNGSYLLYDDSGFITNPAEALKKRIFTATYNSLITGESVIDKGEKIIWYIPLENTMIYPPQLGTEYSRYDLYTNLTTEQLRELGLPCKYARIERAIAEVLDGDPGDEVARQAEQIFRIKDYYNKNDSNNTIYCVLLKNGRQYKAEATLTFGITGTNGTDATFLLQMREVEMGTGGLDQASENPATALTLGGKIAVIPKIYDYNNNDISDEYFKIYTPHYSWHLLDIQLKDQNLVLTKSGNNCIISIKNGVKNIEDCRYYILCATVEWNIVKENSESDIDLNTRKVELKTFLPIPVRVSNEYTQVVGPTQIIYTKEGTNPAYYKSPFVLYKNGLKLKENIEWYPACREYLNSKEDTKERILSFYPKISTDGQLVPTDLYLLDDNLYSVEAKYIERDENKKVIKETLLWTQPILIIQNRYSSAMLNNWDGSFQIDEENGTIMASVIGAGKKDVNNTFSGVLMGDVQNVFNANNHSGLGLYGFNQGAQSFGFNIDGTAFIGKAGRGRINMDGQNGTISSGSFIKPHISDDQKDNSGSGMLIDLDGNDTDKSSSALYAYGSGGAFELNTDKKHPLLRIKSGPYVNSSIMLNIGYGDNPEFYLQSSNFVENKSGTKFDLKDGTLSIFHDNGSYLKMRGDGSPYFQIHDSGTATDGHSEGTDIFYAGLNKYELMSANFISGTAGIFIDLYNGSIDARQGYIGGWQITNSALKAGNITLKAEGSIYGGPSENTWYIDKNGNASFNNLTANLGQIGPFNVSADGLSYKGSLFTIGKDGLNLNNVFTVDLNGQAHFHGFVYFEKGSNIDWRGNGHMINGSLYSGKRYGMGPWGFSNSGGFVGPWQISAEAIYTKGDNSSWLGATGEMKLNNGVTYLKITDDGLEMGNSKSQAKFWPEYISLTSNNGQLWLGNTTYSALSFGDKNYINISSGNITLKSNKITINGDLYPSNEQGSEKGWTGNVVFVDGSKLKFQNGILVGGEVADLVTMS